MVNFRQHLEEELKKDLQLLKEYENERRNENDPGLRGKWNNKIELIKRQIIERQQELENLSQTPEDNEKSFIEDLGFGVKLKMIYIPGGTFTMGAPEREVDSRDSERPRHQETVKPFYMGIYIIITF
jgi:formylglycine-generating enzyme required for sulfatase activity